MRLFGFSPDVVFDDAKACGGAPACLNSRQSSGLNADSFDLGMRRQWRQDLMSSSSSE
jgi:hypothetical protein